VTPLDQRYRDVASSLKEMEKQDASPPEGIDQEASRVERVHLIRNNHRNYELRIFSVALVFSFNLALSLPTVVNVDIFYNRLSFRP